MIDKCFLVCDLANFEKQGPVGESHTSASKKKMGQLNKDTKYLHVVMIFV